MAYNKNLGIKQWAVEDRPREKYLTKGLQSLTNAELIAILIGSGSRNESAVDLAKRILSSANNDLHKLGKQTVAQLKPQKGIGEAKAITIIAALELGRRRKVSDIVNKERVTTSQDAATIAQSIIGDLPHEEFWVFLLNRSQKIISKHKIGQGGVSGTTVDIRIIMKLTIDKLASSIILCHNHPSGNMKPSEVDISLTKKIKQACEILDVGILDHIIVCDDKFYSFADEKML